MINTIMETNVSRDFIDFIELSALFNPGKGKTVAATAQCFNRLHILIWIELLSPIGSPREIWQQRQEHLAYHTVLLCQTELMEVLHIYI